MTSLRRIAVSFLLVLSFGTATAKVEEETLCFQAAANDRLQLALKYYLDSSLNQQLGALVQYGPSKALIPLVFLDESTSDPALDWELHWLEIVGGKPGGTYSLSKPRSATVAAAYLTYRNGKTGRAMLFRPSAGRHGECAIKVEGGPTR